MKTSCGAIFYSYNKKGDLGIILGLEGNTWLPFKGCSEKNESFEETAIREIKEETCNLVLLDNIKLTHKFKTKHKKYYIGLCYVPYDIIEKFDNQRRYENRYEYIEKHRLAFFQFNGLLSNSTIHNLTKNSIRFYWDILMELNYNPTFNIDGNIRREYVV